MDKQYLCPKYEAAFELLGKRWMGIIIKVLFTGPCRFKELNEYIPNISQKMLSERLKELEGIGVIKRYVYPETPVRIQYGLTEKGLALKGVLEEVQDWAEDWMK
ncbi:DNA-binding HxlR family transcriptional regulator [Bacillus pakistanensis]|uniref:DNA-binding HxlR family transcriptional regulator n=1 Tax=Rossellomorea pakistanensis TaxID=992288 RepID=A0ABS2NES0_9BACI|nr:helix-turn-helix domain-containing protein [Bacillus pakistanensis]MBM7586332.1 DNA-binding HxlR family transcriptional regulator [Bacillus pakistanensis]